MNEHQLIARSSSFRSSSGFRSSTRSSRSSSSSRTKSSSSKSTRSKSTTSTKKPATGKSTAKPGSTIKTASGKTVKSSTKTPTNKQYTKSNGIVGDNGYQPRFTNGYSAPAGSVVYYPQHSFVDYLPWIYLFSLGNNSPREDKVTTVEPSGKEVVAKPVKEGVDGLYIFNWIILILIALAALGGIVWLVNKRTQNQ